MQPPPADTDGGIIDSFIISSKFKVVYDVISTLLVIYRFIAARNLLKVIIEEGEANNVKSVNVKGTGLKAQPVIN